MPMFMIFRYVVCCVLALICFVPQGTAEFNVTFINKEMSWNSARNYCFNNGGILESNFTWISISGNRKENYWIGNYQIWSDWAILQGCYENFTEVTKAVIVGDSYDCQLICNEYDYFGIQNTSCYCFNQLPVVSVQYNKCDCTQCVPVYQHHIGEVENTNERKECLSASCRPLSIVADSLIFSAENCAENYEAICESNENIGYCSQQSAVEICEGKGSYLKKYTIEYCQSTSNTNQLWTSSKRKLYTYSVKIDDKNTTADPSYCQYADNDGDELTDLQFGSCTSYRSFFCRFESNTTDSEHITTEFNAIQDATFGAVLAVGVVVIIMGVILVLKCCKQRHNRQKSSKDLSSSMQVIVSVSESQSSETNTLEGKPQQQIQEETKSGEEIHDVMQTNEDIMTKKSEDDEMKTIDEVFSSDTTDNDRFGEICKEEMYSTVDSMYDGTNADHTVIGSLPKTESSEKNNIDLSEDLYSYAEKKQFQTETDHDDIYDIVDDDKSLATSNTENTLSHTYNAHCFVLQRCSDDNSRKSNLSHTIYNKLHDDYKRDSYDTYTYDHALQLNEDNSLYNTLHRHRDHSLVRTTTDCASYDTMESLGLSTMSNNDTIESLNIQSSDISGLE